MKNSVKKKFGNALTHFARSFLMKGSEIDDPGHLIGLKPRRFPNWGARQQPIKICPLCSCSYYCHCAVT